MAVPQIPLYKPFRSAGMILCLLFASLLAFLGLLLHSEATRGVAFLTLACFFGICARLCQAGQQQKEILRAMEAERGPLV